MIRQWLSGIRKFFQNSLVAKINLLFIVLILLFIVFSFTIHIRLVHQIKATEIQ